MAKEFNLVKALRTSAEGKMEDRYCVYLNNDPMPYSLLSLAANKITELEQRLARLTQLKEAS
ncbi:hypothetical protein [Colwellia psychrerythraea]|uniref:Uncharacterized protein n=1 Tax=Colwellia psychrerythraea TaxID=28229 RepID=A0A099KQK6_COLPS|nr:hypothetical protein [Colwellia psychrerythraea]KGJ92152.1 hypothetical protein ND2E_3045 [Colwellia psychrerythraea]